ncbi:hypothetical protein, conserved in T. vivax [Trypanosoma vivax Y486]|uniref:Uncharacterized protein n=1 Tax=Trypanosoma vivax (strain Y486) TaxID=1055687 RepID=F9WTJ2_TRYVY|nr:hypothetical protein, conserved in T. vivax [Trypanosoma vivax Y486]|eukprot:CCD20885.1 hypothetical protein, conserved in T. vivax [Trypanosoma vivax Y486]
MNTIHTLIYFIKYRISARDVFLHGLFTAAGTNNGKRLVRRGGDVSQRVERDVSTSEQCAERARHVQKHIHRLVHALAVIVKQIFGTGECNPAAGRAGADTVARKRGEQTQQQPELDHGQLALPYLCRRAGKHKAVSREECAGAKCVRRQRASKRSTSKHETALPRAPQVLTAQSCHKCQAKKEQSTWGNA